MKIQELIPDAIDTNLKLALSDIPVDGGASLNANGVLKDQWKPLMTALLSATELTLDYFRLFVKHFTDGGPEATEFRKELNFHATGTPYKRLPPEFVRAVLLSIIPAPSKGLIDDLEYALFISAAVQYDLNDTVFASRLKGYVSRLAVSELLHEWPAELAISLAQSAVVTKSENVIADETDATKKAEIANDIGKAMGDLLGPDEDDIRTLVTSLSKEEIWEFKHELITFVIVHRKMQQHIRDNSINAATWVVNHRDQVEEARRNHKTIPSLHPFFAPVLASPFKDGIMMSCNNLDDRLKGNLALLGELSGGSPSPSPASSAPASPRATPAPLPPSNAERRDQLVKIIESATTKLVEKIKSLGPLDVARAVQLQAALDDFPVDGGHSLTSAFFPRDAVEEMLWDLSDASHAFADYYQLIVELRGDAATEATDIKAQFMGTDFNAEFAYEEMPATFVPAVLDSTPDNDYRLHYPIHLASALRYEYVYSQFGKEFAMPTTTPEEQYLMAYRRMRELSQTILTDVLPALFKRKMKQLAEDTKILQTDREAAVAAIDRALAAVLAPDERDPNSIVDLLGTFEEVNFSEHKTNCVKFALLYRFLREAIDKDAIGPDETPGKEIDESMKRQKTPDLMTVWFDTANDAASPWQVLLRQSLNKFVERLGDKLVILDEATANLPPRSATAAAPSPVGGLGSAATPFETALLTTLFLGAPDGPMSAWYTDRNRPNSLTIQAEEEDLRKDLESLTISLTGLQWVLGNMESDRAATKRLLFADAVLDNGRSLKQSQLLPVNAPINEILSYIWAVATRIVDYFKLFQTTSQSTRHFAKNLRRNIAGYGFDTERTDYKRLPARFVTSIIKSVVGEGVELREQIAYAIYIVASNIFEERHSELAQVLRNSLTPEQRLEDLAASLAITVDDLKEGTLILTLRKEVDDITDPDTHKRREERYSTAIARILGPAEEYPNPLVPADVELADLWEHKAKLVSCLILYKDIMTIYEDGYVTADNAWMKEILEAGKIRRLGAWFDPDEDDQNWWGDIHESLDNLVERLFDDLVNLRRVVKPIPEPPPFLPERRSVPTRGPAREATAADATTEETGRAATKASESEATAAKPKEAPATAAAAKPLQNDPDALAKRKAELEAKIPAADQEIEDMAPLLAAFEHDVKYQTFITSTEARRAIVTLLTEPFNPELAALDEETRKKLEDAILMTSERLYRKMHSWKEMLELKQLDSAGGDKLVPLAAARIALEEEEKKAIDEALKKTKEVRLLQEREYKTMLKNAKAAKTEEERQAIHKKYDSRQSERESDRREAAELDQPDVDKIREDFARRRRDFEENAPYPELQKAKILRQLAKVPNVFIESHKEIGPEIAFAVFEQMKFLEDYEQRLADEEYERAVSPSREEAVNYVIPRYVKETVTDKDGNTTTEYNEVKGEQKKKYVEEHAQLWSAVRKAEAGAEARRQERGDRIKFDGVRAELRRLAEKRKEEREKALKPALESLDKLRKVKEALKEPEAELEALKLTVEEKAAIDAGILRYVAPEDGSKRRAEVDALPDEERKAALKEIEEKSAKRVVIESRMEQINETRYQIDLLRKKARNHAAEALNDSPSRAGKLLRRIRDHVSQLSALLDRLREGLTNELASQLSPLIEAALADPSTLNDARVKLESITEIQPSDIWQLYHNTRELVESHIQLVQELRNIHVVRAEMPYYTDNEISHWAYQIDRLLDESNEIRETTRIFQGRESTRQWTDIANELIIEAVRAATATNAPKTQSRLYPRPRARVPPSLDAALQDRESLVTELNSLKARPEMSDSRDGIASLVYRPRSDIAQKLDRVLPDGMDAEKITDQAKTGELPYIDDKRGEFLVAYMRVARDVVLATLSETPMQGLQDHEPWPKALAVADILGETPHYTVGYAIYHEVWRRFNPVLYAGQKDDLTRFELSEQQVNISMPTLKWLLSSMDEFKSLRIDAGLEDDLKRMYEQLASKPVSEGHWTLERIMWSQNNEREVPIDTTKLLIRLWEIKVVLMEVVDAFVAMATSFYSILEKQGDVPPPVSDFKTFFLDPTDRNQISFDLIGAYFDGNPGGKPLFKALHNVVQDAVLEAQKTLKIQELIRPMHAARLEQRVPEAARLSHGRLFRTDPRKRDGNLFHADGIDFYDNNRGYIHETRRAAVTALAGQYPTALYEDAWREFNTLCQTMLTPVAIANLTRDGMPLMSGSMDRLAQHFTMASWLALNRDGTCQTIISPVRASITARGVQGITDFVFKMNMGHRFPKPFGIAEIASVFPVEFNGGMNTRIVGSLPEIRGLLRGEYVPGRRTANDLIFVPSPITEKTVEYPINFFGDLPRDRSSTGRFIDHLQTKRTGHWMLRHFIGEEVMRSAQGAVMAKISQPDGIYAMLPFCPIIEAGTRYYWSEHKDDYIKLACGTGPMGPAQFSNYMCAAQIMNGQIRPFDAVLPARPNI